MMNYLVVGQGSMGKRRVRCLLANDVLPDQITVFDTREDRLQESKEKYGVNVTADYDGVLRQASIRAVFVSVPGFLHVQYCLAAARAGKHWFCEVPLSVNPDGIDELEELTRRRELVGAPGCQVLHHPLGRSLKDWSTGPLGGPVLAASYACGMYLPDWHPYEDYRTFYASSKSQGGGNLDILAQELVWIFWVIDRAVGAVNCREARTSSLELADGTPDQQAIIIEFRDGPVLSIHLDLVDRTHERLIRLVTDKSTVKWSTLDKCLQQYEATEKIWTRIDEPEGYNYESCYHDEVGQFLRCIEKREPWPVTLETAKQIVRILLAVEQSCTTECTVRLPEVPE